MLLRQVQARPLQGHHLRALRRRGDAPEGAPRAHGPHRPGRAGLAHLVLQGRAEPHRLPARHRSARAREGAVLRRLDRHERRQRGAREGPERPRGQGQGRVRADLRRPRRAARRAREAARPPARVLRRGQGEGLRRGRRLLDPRARHLGRGADAPAARGRAQARRRALPGARPADHDRGREEDPRARPQRRDPRRPQAHPARARAGRRRRPSRSSRRSCPLEKELGKAAGAKKGAITKHIHRIVDALLTGEELTRGRREARRGASTRRTSRRRATSATASSRTSSTPGKRARTSASSRTTCACGPTGRSRRRISTR